MTEKERKSLVDFIQNAKRSELEQSLYTLLVRWPFSKAKSFCKSAVIQGQIDELEGVKKQTIYKNVQNSSMKLVKEYGHQHINNAIAELKNELKTHKEIFEKHKVNH